MSLVEGSNSQKEASNAYQFPSKTITITYCPPHFFQGEAAQARLCRHFGYSRSIRMAAPVNRRRLRGWRNSCLSREDEWFAAAVVDLALFL